MDIAGIYARAADHFAPAEDLIQRGNVDIEASSTWTPTRVEPSASDLPIYPGPADLLVEPAPGVGCKCHRGKHS